MENFLKIDVIKGRRRAFEIQKYFSMNVCMLAYFFFWAARPALKKSNYTNLVGKLGLKHVCRRYAGFRQSLELCFQIKSTQC